MLGPKKQKVPVTRFIRCMHVRLTTGPMQDGYAATTFSMTQKTPQHATIPVACGVFLPTLLEGLQDESPPLGMAI